MKKVLSVLLTAVVIFSLCTVAFAATANEEAKLRFGTDGEFKIMHLSDVQDAYPIEEPTMQFINEVLDAEKPDLVVLGGDNINTAEKEIFEQFTEPFISRGIYFTLVFGNHDSENTKKSKEELLALFQEYGQGYCLAYDAVPELHGVGTHNLPVYASDGSDKVKFNVWLFDSGEYIVNEKGEHCGYDCVRKDQIEWYKRTSTALKEANGGKVVPSMAFQHIIMGDIMDELYYKVDFSLGELTKSVNGQNYFLVPTAHGLKNLDGFLNEPPCPGAENEGQLDAFAEMGDVLGCCTGHDHINSFVYNIKGVDLIQTPGCTYDSYGNTMTRGVRIITVKEDNPSVYETKVVTVSEMALKEESKLTECKEITKIGSFFGVFGAEFLMALEKAFKALFFFVK